MTRQGKVKAIPVIRHDLGRERERRNNLTFKNWFYRPKRGSLARRWNCTNANSCKRRKVRRWVPWSERPHAREVVRLSGAKKWQAAHLACHKMITGELAPARLIPSVATLAGNPDQIGL